jgi:lysophospholipase L1-like esterase
MRSLRLGFLSLLLFGIFTLEAADTPALLRIREVIASGENEVRVVCFGDSVTGVYYHTGGRSAYPEVIRDALKARHPEGRVKVINAGKSGHTTTNGLGRIQQDVLVHKPHLVTVMFGLNDVAKGNIDLYRKNLVEIVTKCRSAGAEVILCTPNAVSETPDRPIAKVAAFAEVARAVAGQLSVPLADAHASLEALRESDPETWRLSMSDEIHPNLRGHRRLAESILGVIEGEAVELPDDKPVPAPLSFTLAKLQKNLPVKVLAMPPFDAFATEAIQSVHPGANVTVMPWPTEGMNRYTLMKDAAHRVRPLTPDLVILAVPRSATAKDTEEFIRTQMWIAANSLSRGSREWDVIVVHPEVVEAPAGETDTNHDRLIREIVPAQDLGLIRGIKEKGTALEVFTDWLRAAATP